jgi:DNA-binding NtrC family response regulator
MSKRKVLVVDDEQDICDSFKELLERRNCQVFTALKTEDAWEIFQRERPAACSIDIHMPFSAFDGLELLRRIREVDKEVFCIVFTVEEEKEAKEKAERLGTNIYRQKPATIEELEEIMGMLAGR